MNPRKGHLNQKLFNLESSIIFLYLKLFIQINLKLNLFQIELIILVSKRFEIDEYKIRLSHSLKANIKGVQIIARGIVSCYGEGLRLIVYFLDDYSKVPEPYFDVEKDDGTLFLPFEQISAYVDLLRNEKPVYGYLNSEVPHYNSITTSKEPVGEEEED